MLSRAFTDHNVSLHGSPGPCRAWKICLPQPQYETCSWPGQKCREANGVFMGCSCYRKFGKYLEENLRPQWRQNYVDYKLLKDLIKASLAELEGDDNARLSFSPRTTSLTVQRANRGRRNSEEEFFEVLEQQVPAFRKPL